MADIRLIGKAVVDQIVLMVVPKRYLREAVRSGPLWNNNDNLHSPNVSQTRS